jgi:hypothetical protein
MPAPRHGSPPIPRPAIGDTISFETERSTAAGAGGAKAKAVAGAGKTAGMGKVVGYRRGMHVVQAAEGAGAVELDLKDAGSVEWELTLEGNQAAVKRKRKRERKRKHGAGSEAESASEPEAVSESEPEPEGGGCGAKVHLHPFFYCHSA